MLSFRRLSSASLLGAAGYTVFHLRGAENEFLSIGEESLPLTCASRQRDCQSLDNAVLRHILTVGMTQKQLIGSGRITRNALCHGCARSVHKPSLLLQNF